MVSPELGSGHSVVSPELCRLAECVFRVETCIFVGPTESALAPPAH